jgi:hypothetical protein
VGRSLLLISVILTMTNASWCQPVSDHPAFVARGLLPSPAPGALKFAGRIPTHPFHLEASKVLSRTVFSTIGPSNSQVEIRDVFVPPHGNNELAAVPGPTLVDVYFGGGTVLIAGTRQKLTAGDTIVVAADEVLKFEPSGVGPMVLRLYIFEAR